jgi:hypothetical protein
MPIAVKTTSRGFTIGEFKDRYGKPCSIQKSSLASEPCIWLGVKEALGEPSRMHLTQQQVADLLPLLQHFVETGDLPSS